MTTNPYAPPAVPVADFQPPATGLKRRRVVVMLLFTLVTFALYYPIWFLRRRQALNSLDSPRKLLLWPFALSVAVFVVDVSLGFALGVEQDAAIVLPDVAKALDSIGFVSGILILWQSFVTKDILQDHLQRDVESSSMFSSRRELSGLMTFFFGIFYLQHVINRDILSPRAESGEGPLS